MLLCATVASRTTLTGGRLELQSHRRRTHRRNASRFLTNAPHPIQRTRSLDLTHHPTPMSLWDSAAACQVAGSRRRKKERLSSIISTAPARPRLRLTAIITSALDRMRTGSLWVTPSVGALGARSSPSRSCASRRYRATPAARRHMGNLDQMPQVHSPADPHGAAVPDLSGKGPSAHG